MKQFTGKARLYAGAATMAVITGWTAPAAAQCVTDTNTVNCSGTVTSDQVNTAVNGVTPPNVTVRVATDATVTRTAPAIQPSSTFTGAVDIANAGTVGSTAAPVGVAYSGSIANSANTFSIANSGLVTGAVSANNVGGAITATNSGTLAGGVQLQGAGSLSLTSSGPVYVSAGGAGTTAVNLQSRRIVETRTGTAGVDALVTSTSTAGAVNATITGPVAIPAAPGGTATRQGVQVISAGTGGSARLALDAAAGAVTVSTAASDSSFTPGVNVVTVDGTTTARSSTSSTQVGGAATAIIGANAQIGSLTVQAGRGSANASIAGRVGSTAAPGFVSVTATGFDSANSSETVTTAAGSATRTARSTTPVGGAASLEISDTGQVVGRVTVASNASSAAATVAGTLGGIDGSTFVGGSLFVDARGTRTTNTDTSTVAGAANSGASASSSAVSTGTASATVATSGRVLGSVNALASGGAATTTISGAVGATGDVVVTGNAVADSRGATTSQNSAFANAANGDSTSNSTFSQTNTGGIATTTIAAGGSVAGNANAISNASDASVTVAGTVGAGDGATIAVQGNVLADTRGSNSTRTRTDSFTAASNDYTFAEKTTQTLSGGAASATTAATGAVFGNMTAIGDRGATIDNAGRVRDFAQASSTRSVLLSNESSGSRVTTPGAGGASSVVTRNAGASVTQTGGGTASLTNRAGGVIEDGAFVSGASGASFTNAGAIFGNVSVTSTGSRQENTNTSVSTLTSTPQPAGGAIVRQEDVSSQTSTVSPVGGAATGVYGGTIGAAQGSSLAANTTVNQVGQTGSTATVSGTLFADLSTSVGATRTESTSSSSNLSVTQAATGTATPAVETTGSSTSRNSATAIGAANTVTVTGALRNNGFGTGDLFASGNAGTTTVTIDGGTIAGSVNASSAGSNTINGSDSAFRNTRAATAAGPVAPLVAQSQSSSNYSEQRRTAGTASVALTGTARVEGAVTVSGVGTGAGSTGAAATVASTAAINGALSVNAGTGTDARSDSSSVSTRTGPAAVTRTDRFSQTTTRSANAGNASATIAGTVGGQLTVNAPYGNASATLSGQVLNGGGITIASGGTLNSSSSEQSYRGTSTTMLSTPIQTAATSQSAATAAGGAANLSITSAGTTAAAGLSAVNGSITVGGFAGSALTIGAGTRVLATNGGSIFVGRTDYNFAQSSSATFNAAGARTGQTDVATYVAVGAPASISNAGIIGASTGFYGAPVAVEAFGVAGASVANTGTVYGNVIADALSYDYTSTTTQSGLTDPVTQQSVFVATTTLVGGLGAVSNAGVVSGNVAVSGATGTIANSGVIRGGATLGSSVFAGTETSTQTATNNSYLQAAPTARFVQSYTLNQNGLLLGGVAVRDPRVPDFSTGAASNATLRTSDIRATINLNNGSITTGNVTAPVDTANARLSDTTLNLVGAGYLGAGTGLTPPAALGVGAAPLRYENTPNFAGFAAIDPALGNSASGTFLPSVGIASGSRISGVNLVDRSGAGVFTVVGAPYLSVSNANPLPVYTMDVGTLRISSGELQLGVAGADPATGAAIFAVRGNVVNNGGTLLLGRRVTDGTTSVVQGVNLRVDGNFTQAAGGTLSLAASPSLVRIAGTQVGALPAAGVLGFGGYGVALTPFVPFDPLATNQLRSTPSTLTVNGNLTLAGSVSIAAQPGAIYTAGRNADLITVSGTYNGSGLTVLTPSASPFVRFVLTPRTVGTQTVVSVDVARTSYASVTTTSNAGAAATALDAAVPSVVARLRAIPNPNAVTDVAGYAAIQDLATVISALDTQLSASDAAIAFNQLGSGSVYGSLSALATTAPFGDAAEAPIGDEGGIGLWARPSGLFSRFSGDGTSGAGRLRTDNYGGALGVSISTGEEGVIGFGGGYGRIDARDKGFPSNASADTYMIGAFGRQRYEGFDLAVQAVFGWSNWDTVRALPLFSRTATASFDSSEFRLTARVAYDLSLSGVILTPFGRLDMRRYSFEAFQEQNAGGIGLNVGRRRDRVISPEAGVRVGGEVGIFRPFAEASYVFQGDTGSERRVSYIGDPANSFRLRGVDPEGYARIGAGISADAYGASFNLRGTYLAGGGNRAGEVLGGVTFRF